MPGPSPQHITITPRQRRVLARIVRRETSTQQQVRRAQLVLAAAESSNAQVARQVDVAGNTARTWRTRWGAATEALLAAEAEGDDGALEQIVLGVLADEPRPGAPATFTPEQICQIIALACTPPGGATQVGAVGAAAVAEVAPTVGAGRPISHWTPRELADEAVKRGIVPAISPASVGRFFKRGRSQTAPEPVLAHPRA